jgi:DNA-binding protein HU-beta
MDMAKASKNTAAKAAPAKAAPAKSAAKAAPAKAAPAKAAKANPVSRGEVVDIVAAQSGLTRSQAEGAIKAYEGAIIRTLTDGGEVRLGGFGTFKTSERAARTGRNPQTGGTVEVPARTVPRFSASSAFKGSVGGTTGGGAAKGGAAKGGAAKTGAAKGATKAAAKGGATKGAAKGKK